MAFVVVGTDSWAAGASSVGGTGGGLASAAGSPRTCQRRVSATIRYGGRRQSGR